VGPVIAVLCVLWMSEPDVTLKLVTTDITRAQEEERQWVG
jgi:hypothetical protein